MGCCTSTTSKKKQSDSVPQSKGERSTFETPDGRPSTAAQGLPKESPGILNQRRQFQESEVVSKEMQEKANGKNQDTPDDGLEDDNDSSPEKVSPKKAVFIKPDEVLVSALKRAIFSLDKGLLKEVLQRDKKLASHVLD